MLIKINRKTNQKSKEIEVAMIKSKVPRKFLGNSKMSKELVRANSKHFKQNLIFLSLFFPVFIHNLLLA